MCLHYILDTTHFFLTLKVIFADHRFLPFIKNKCYFAIYLHFSFSNCITYIFQ